MGNEAFTVRANSKKVRQLDKLAKLQAWQIERTKEGIQAADEGRFVGGAEMNRIFGKYKNAQ